MLLDRGQRSAIRFALAAHAASSTLLLPIAVLLLLLLARLTTTLLGLELDVFVTDGLEINVALLAGPAIGVVAARSEQPQAP